MIRFCLLASLTFTALPARAFVENVTHGYVNCTACHISPTGGGLLTEYGRSLSRELMSTWGWTGAEDPLFGLAKNSDRVLIGGDIRHVQTYLENAERKQGRNFLMQQNAELGLHWGKTWWVGAFGTQEGPRGTPDKGHFLSERHYALWETSDDTRLRVGKFRLGFGLQDPNHTRATKAPFGFGSNSETYALEFTKYSDKDEFTLATALGRLDRAHDPSSERSLSATYAHYVGAKTKLGVSVLTGESEQLRRNVTALFGVTPLGERGVIKFEVTGQKSTPSSTPENSESRVAAQTTLGLTLAKGLTPYLLFEYLHRDLEDPTTKEHAPGLGLQWLPIPHVELQAEYKHQSSTSLPPTNIAWFLIHIYL